MRVVWLSLLCAVGLSEFGSCWIFTDSKGVPDAEATDPSLDPPAGAVTASGRESHRREAREKPFLFPGAVDSPLEGSGCPTIISRAQWGARPPNNKVSLVPPVPHVIIHHTDGNPCASQAACSQEVRRIQDDHMDKKGWADIGYNFLIGEDGGVYEGCGWSTRGSHAGEYNPTSLGLSFLGSFSETAPSAAALNAARSLVQCAVSRGFLSRSYTLKGHRNVNPTSCPGNALYRVITQWPGFKA
uniref:Short-type peptidoglycan recognition protein n=1 Tax=Pelodiscus sinensis TaxID=13735 RepID=A0A8G0VZY7_PELSI|nr:short-type peptidoglycan recognition protein [Pelodiscus sinensis]